jgi:1-aminocyclopropane-1-carboxylate deaminase
MVEVRDEQLDAHRVRLLLKRDDLIHPDLPGNRTAWPGDGLGGGG